MRVLDPDHICGDDVTQTMSLRQRCIHALIFLGNVAGELLCMWDTTSSDGMYIFLLVGIGVRRRYSHLFPLIKEASWNPESCEEPCHVTYDHEGHLVCAEHPISQLVQDCAYCQHRRHSFVESAKSSASNFDDPETVATIVYTYVDRFRHPTSSLRM